MGKHEKKKKKFEYINIHKVKLITKVTRNLIREGDLKR